MNDKNFSWDLNSRQIMRIKRKINANERRREKRTDTFSVYASNLLMSNPAETRREEACFDQRAFKDTFLGLKFEWFLPRNLLTREFFTPDSLNPLETTLQAEGAHAAA